MKATFTTTILKDESVNATGLKVPPETVAALGPRKTPPVKVSLGDYTYRTTIAVVSGAFMVPLSAAHREAAGLKAGDQVEVTLELDQEPRTVEVPADLLAALSEKAGAKEAFEALAFSRRKEFVRQVEEAKTAETRNRRISKIISQLSEG